MREAWTSDALFAPGTAPLPQATTEIEAETSAAQTSGDLRCVMRSTVALHARAQDTRTSGHFGSMIETSHSCFGSAMKSRVLLS
jgi:hypothetical protein